MEDNLKIKNLTQLFKRVKPALNSKLREINDMKIIYIKDKDIFDFLRETKWINATNLCLAEVVDDILNVDINKLNVYVQKKLIDKVKK